MPRPSIRSVRRLILTALALCIAHSAGARETTPRMPPEQLDALARQYPNAPVLALREWAHLTGDYNPKHDGIHAHFRRGHELWIRDTRGIESVARVAAISSPLRKLEHIRIQIESNDGQRRELDQEDLRWIERPAQDGLVFSLDTKHSYAVIPGLRAGDRVWIEQTHEFKGVHGLPIWQFGGLDVPCAESRFTLELPRGHTLETSWRGPAEIQSRREESITEAGDRTIYTWSLTDLQPHRPESLSYGEPTESVILTPHIASFGGAYPTDAFASGPSWSEVGQRYLTHIASVFDASPEIARAAQTIAGHLEDRTQRIEALYTYVQKSCRYLGLFEGLDGIIPRPAQEIHETGHGDCKGLATLLISMLRAVDVEAHPVLLRTRSAGPSVTLLPNMTQFNHFTVWANDGKDGLWLDPTYDGCPAGVVPVQNAAWPVLLLRPERAELRSIPTELWEPMPIHIRLNGQLDEDGRLHLELSERRAGSTALGVRTAALSATNDQRAASISARLLPQTISMRMLGFDTVSLDDWSAELECRLSAQTPSSLPKGRNELFLPRVLAPLPERRLFDAERTSPIDLRFRPARIEEWTIALPAGVKLTPVEELRVEVEGLSWTRRIWQEEDGLHLSREIVWKHERLDPEQAPELVEALDRIHEDESLFLSLRMIGTDSD